MRPGYIEVPLHTVQRCGILSFGGLPSRGQVTGRALGAEQRCYAKGSRWWQSTLPAYQGVVAAVCTKNTGDPDPSRASALVEVQNQNASKTAQRKFLPVPG